jgi:hypothetical protein
LYCRTDSGTNTARMIATQMIVYWMGCPTTTHPALATFSNLARRPFRLVGVTLRRFLHLLGRVTGKRQEHIIQVGR